MCRYAMSGYKPHYACFNCRKTFKRRHMWDINRDDKTKVEAKCPQCKNLMADMGLDFSSPKKDDIKRWTHLKNLYTAGITYHSCGCTGPGYIPNSTESLIAYFNEALKNCHDQLNFWRHRTEPRNEPELNREMSKNWSFLRKIPREARSTKGAITNEDAKKFWLGQLKEIEEKLAKLQKASDQT